MALDSSIVKSANIQYEFSYSDMLLVRETVEGETAIKNSDQIKTVYLPDPRFTDTTNPNLSRQAQEEYQSYKNGADYDNFSETTLASWVGLMSFDQADIELPPSIDHLEENADGDGLSLNELMELTASNVFQMKFHGLLVEYGNEFGEFPEEQITKQQAQALGLRSSIKSYPRESIVDWDFGLVNGVKSLTFVKLKEEVIESDYEKLTQEIYTNYLICALDDNGFYYQKKFYKVSGIGGNSHKMEESDPVYPEANGQMLDFIPFEFVFDQQIQKGVIPRQMGPLYPICRKAISIFRTSADLNRALRVVGIPTVFTKGWKQGDDQIFRDVNEGRSSITFGSGTSNNLPNDVDVDVVQMDGTNQPLFEQMNKLYERAKILGARIDLDMNQAEQREDEVKARNAKETAMLVNVANSIQACFYRLLKWCALFEGDENADPVIELSKDFSNAKISVEERKQITNEVGMGQISVEESRKLLSEGGVTIDADEDIAGFDTDSDTN